jgi:hypothetical protein
MTEVDARVMMREEVDALRVFRAKRTLLSRGAGDTIGDLLATLLAAWEDLDKVDRFAADTLPLRADDQNILSNSYARGYNAAVGELRALRGIEG